MKEEAEAISQKQQCRHHGDYDLNGSKGNWVKIKVRNVRREPRFNNTDNIRVKSRTEELEVIKFREKASCIKIEDSQVVREEGRGGVWGDRREAMMSNTL